MYSIEEIANRTNNWPRYDCHRHERRNTFFVVFPIKYLKLVIWSSVFSQRTLQLYWGDVRQKLPGLFFCWFHVTESDAFRLFASVCSELFLLLNGAEKRSQHITRVQSCWIFKVLNGTFKFYFLSIVAMERFTTWAETQTKWSDRLLYLLTLESDGCWLLFYWFCLHLARV